MWWIGAAGGWVPGGIATEVRAPTAHFECGSPGSCSPMRGRHGGWGSPSPVWWAGAGVQWPPPQTGWHIALTGLPAGWPIPSQFAWASPSLPAITAGGARPWWGGTIRGGEVTCGRSGAQYGRPAGGWGGPLPTVGGISAWNLSPRMIRG